MRGPQGQSTIIPKVRCAPDSHRFLARCLLALTLATLPAPHVSAEAAEPVATAPATAPEAIEPVYRVVIDAPSSLVPALERSLGIVRWQGYADMTADLMDRLAGEAEGEAREAVAAEGYFSARIEIAIDRATKPAKVTLTIVPGEPTRIADVHIDVTGPAATDEPLGTAAIAQMRAQWELPVGEVFRQSAWDTAKNRALASLRASPYAAATIAQSEALIDPDARDGPTLARVRERSGVSLR